MSSSFAKYRVNNNYTPILFITYLITFIRKNVSNVSTLSLKTIQKSCLGGRGFNIGVIIHTKELYIKKAKPGVIGATESAFKFTYTCRLLPTI